MKNSTFRVSFLDEVRGLAILLMILYHALYDYVVIFDYDLNLFYSLPVQILPNIIITLFALVSGISCRYSQNNLKRGLLLLFFGAVITISTWIIIPSQIVLFGVLHFLGAAIIIFAFAHRFLDKINPLNGVVLSVGLFFLTYYIDFNHVSTNFLFPLGLHAENFYSSDYYPLLPWLFLFISGTYLGLYFKLKLLPSYLYSSHFPILARIGKWSLFIYLLHQPILFSILYLLLK